MPSLPLPIFGTLVLLFLSARLWRLRDGPSMLAALLALCAGQTLILALAQHYGVSGMRLVQPVTATLIAPFAWVTYQATAVRALRQGDLRHALVPLTALAALLTAPAFLDVFIPGVFAVYGLAILLECRKGPDAQPRMSLASAELPARIWLFIGGMLMASALSDVLIYGAQLAGLAGWRPWIISLFTVGNLILIGLLSLSDHLETDTPAEEPIPPVANTQDTAVFDAVQAHMDSHQPFLNPDLTLSKLSRRLGIPAKTLSIAINRSTGQNVSRYVNDARIAWAQALLRKDGNVTTAMLASGFNTKSNFNREFLRVTGCNPRAWLAEQNL